MLIAGYRPGQGDFPIKDKKSGSSTYFVSELETELESVKQIILDNVKSHYPQISQPLERLVTAKSKMLRPAFIILSSKFGNPDHVKILSLAAAVEMLHTATLIHDDIIDKASTRRGQASLHKLAGPSRSVLMGDYLISRGIRLIINRIGTNNFEILTSVVSHLCESEIAEASSSFNCDISEREYIRRIAGKTASLFALSCHTGASESGCTTETTSALRRCGYCTGMAFQIIDDILDFRSSSSKMGKPCGNDLREGTFTLPVLYALKRDNGTYRKHLKGLKTAGRFTLERKTREAIRITEELGGISLAREKAVKYTNRALSEIERLPRGEAREDISALVSRLLDREY